jgi:predicted MFS family arabinose efflux permease
MTSTIGRGDGARRRVFRGVPPAATLIVATLSLLCSYCAAVLSLALPDVQRDLAIAEGDLGLWLAIIRAGPVVALPIALWADRWPRNSIPLFSCAGTLAGALSTAVAFNTGLFASAQVAVMAFSTAFQVSAIVVIVRSTAAERRAQALGLFGVALGLGEGLAALAYPLATLAPGGWRALYVLPAPGFVLVGLAALATRFRSGAQPSSPGMPVAAATPFHRMLKDIKDRASPLASVAATSFIYHAALAPPLIFASMHLQGSQGLEPGQVSALMLASGAFALAGNMVGMGALQRLGARAALVLFSVTTGVAFVLFYLSPQAAAVALWPIAVFCSLAGGSILLALSNEDCGEAARNTVNAGLILVAAAGSAAGLVLEAWIFRFYGSHAVAISALQAGFGLSAAIALLYAGRPVPRAV